MVFTYMLLSLRFRLLRIISIAPQLDSNTLALSSVYVNDRPDMWWGSGACNISIAPELDINTLALSSALQLLTLLLLILFPSPPSPHHFSWSPGVGGLRG